MILLEAPPILEVAEPSYDSVSVSEGMVSVVALGRISEVVKLSAESSTELV